MSADTKLRGHLVTIALAVLVSVAFLLVILKAGGQIGRDEPYTVKALIPDAQDVYPGATVRLAGLRIGSVGDVERRGKAAIIGLNLEDRYAPIRRDARIEVRLRTVAGENYVELYPGTAAAPELQQGDVLPMSQAVEPVQIDQVLSVLDKRTRARAGQLFQGLAGGIGDRGPEVNDLVDGLSRTVQDAAPVADVLADDRRQLAGLIDGLGTITATIGRRSADLKTFAHQGTATAQALADRDDAVRDTLEALPGTLTQIRETTETLRAVSNESSPVVRNLAAALNDLEPTLSLLEPGATRARETVLELGRAETPLRRVLSGVREVAPGLSGSLPPLRDAFCELNPLAEYLRPYTPEVGVHLANLASGANWYNVTGHGARVHSVLSESSAAVFTPELSAAADKLLSIGALEKIRGLGWNPYPAPGKIGDTQTGSDDTGPHDSSLPYERLQPAC